ncbi:MAG: methionine gamma-lyase family protein [Bacilli bacterium]|nr:methionine gamma-lyase family protein [Bacilli bacterium]MBR4672195.1 methionine gamma-lyase family protein [Bacilli bacterium]
MISEETLKLFEESEKEVEKEFKELDSKCDRNSLKVLNAFKNNNISEAHFNSTTGYGYNDIGRDAIEKVFAEVLGAEDALVRSQFISGSHALTVTLFALLRPNDTLLSISGKPYDTLDEVIGIVDNPSSLKSFNVNYEQIDLINDDFDYEAIEKKLKEKKIKVIEIQRSKGYSTRKSIVLSKIDKVIKFIREIDEDIIIMIDNCYCEFVEDKSPLEIENPADVIVGSLIKNLGGGIAPNGAYVAGKKHLIDLVADRLTVPGEGREVGPTLGINKQLLQGIFMAPSVVCSSLKTAVLTSKVLEKLGFDVEPKCNDERCDIVQNIIFHNKDKLIKYCQGIQAGSPIDSNAVPLPWDMPGYTDQVIMAAGAFTQGSSIEMSCDGPIREPYIAYQQGGLTYNYGKIAVMYAVEKIKE